MRSGVDQVSGPRRYDEPDSARSRRGRNALYIVFTVVVTAVVALALVEAIVGFPGFGIDTNTATASARGTTLRVRYAEVTRGQLASPFHVTVEHEGGFDGPVSLAVSSEYLDLFLTNDLSPAPTSETAEPDALLMTFDAPPHGDTLSVRWDLVAKPAAEFTTRTGTAAVLDDAGGTIVSVDFTTRVRV